MTPDRRPRRTEARPKREDARPARDDARPKPEAPPIPPEVKYEDLDKEVRARLRSLSKGNAEDIGRHLMMVGLLLEDDPETAYLHAQVAVSRGGRIDAVREVAALAAYATGRYAEALRELRTVRRLSGSVEHLAMEADCERGLRRPERAVALSQSPEAGRLSPEAAVELKIVLAGARLDMGDPEAALLTLQRIEPPNEESAARVREATVDALRALGRDDEAEDLASTLPDWDAEAGEEVEEVVVYDLEEDPEEEKT
ncbi:MAG: hypothetical protein JW722_06015 [Demequinaceae bacterium]|nr:hypothetical protein [Demequinaceae bacterium]